MRMSNQGPMNFKIDPTSFTMVMVMDLAPKLKFGSDTDQECLRNGTPKWVAQVTVGFQAFGRPSFSVLNVTIASHEDPRHGFQPGMPCELVGFEVGVMDKTIKDKNTGEDKVVGAQVYYRADAIRPIGGSGRKNEQAA
ncbi:hypothetical protein Ae717Ps2_7348c [Pseudonocardia sp. Ae717_Ps2]|uniref:hypothetical protein n=3 Tax=Pseudonocardia sp. Ae717_Ps2 TaxID=1885573 RepID=UPI00094B251E|nr:hypothetical protein [Pseudonocardia sp. Ae717_Ps2]OLM27543.1 hypothetical protein Ae717Ps2_7319c [Pseudonocardia sp. Ae717_Ps2]OLM27558.1 hypothetical protein Ae717Ps2_7334c [Pseudonocardia sp. Ae717_Ps2]OLM27572.1 hypothetical protein Ae717Ps2_7348c [Pseudonocardia sp. Ae717_Ps2]